MADRPPALTRQDAEDFLYREAALLDEGRLDEWLALFTDDGLYRLPVASGDDELEPALVHNVQVEALSEDEALIRCNLTVHEVRVGGPEQVGLGRLRVLPARAAYVVRLGPPLHIRSKTVHLLERE